MARNVNDLSDKEYDELCISLEGIKIVDVENERGIGTVFIEGHPDVKRVRFHYSNLELEDYLRNRIGDVIDMSVFPYEWEIGSQSGTVYYFRKATIKESDAPR